MVDAVIATPGETRGRVAKKRRSSSARTGILPAAKTRGVAASTPVGAKPTRHFYVDMFRASPIDRIGIIKAGVPARDAKLLMGEFDFDQQVLFSALSLKTATVNRKAAANQTLSTEDGERVLGLAKLVGQVAAMIEESGSPEDFDVPTWLSGWLREPLPAFGGTIPLEMLDTMEGQALVSGVLAQMQSGAYA